MDYQRAQMSLNRKICILIADDHALFRQGLRRILESNKDVTVIGEAADGDEAIQRAQELRPDIILMDVSMPHKNGLEATQKIRHILPNTSIILLTMHEDSFLQKDGACLGASGYLPKKSVDRELFEAINSVSSGAKYFYSSHGDTKEPPAAALSYESLSFREREILRLLAGGMTNKEISQLLYISINTVETHRKNIMRKLNLHNLSEIIKYTLIHGIIRSGR